MSTTALPAFDQEPITELWPEALPLMEAVWRDRAPFSDWAFDPRCDVFEALHNAGSLRCFTVRSEGALAGLAVFVVMRNLMAGQVLDATNELAAFAPTYRNPDGVLGLIRFAESRLWADGVDCISHRIRVPYLQPLLPSRGYHLADGVWMKRRDGVTPREGITA